MSEGILELGDDIVRAQRHQAQRRQTQQQQQQQMMELYLAMFESTYTAWAIVAGLAVMWHYHIESVVPKPYLVRLAVPIPCNTAIVADSET